LNWRRYNKSNCKPRVARGGRIVFDRKDPLTREAYGGGKDDPRRSPRGTVEGLPTELSDDEETPVRPSFPYVR
jgi:hypothetical protein